VIYHIGSEEKTTKPQVQHSQASLCFEVTAVMVVVDKMLHKLGSSSRNTYFQLEQATRGPWLSCWSCGSCWCWTIGAGIRSDQR